MNKKLKVRLEQSFELTHDLVSHLDEPALGLDLPGLPSNRMAEQVWCIVGARESYTKAINAGGWQGFSCSLRSPRVKDSVLAALEATHQGLRGVDFAGLTDAQLDLAFGLLDVLVGNGRAPARPTTHPSDRTAARFWIVRERR